MYTQIDLSCVTCLSFSVYEYTLAFNTVLQYGMSKIVFLALLLCNMIYMYIYIQ